MRPTLLLATCLIIAGCGDKKPPSAAATSQSAAKQSIQIHGYDFVLPNWWNSIRESLPDEVVGEDYARNYIRKRCGAESGTTSTWRNAMKLWVQHYIREDRLPVYIAHSYGAGGQHADAARVYGELQALAGQQGEEADWYGAYLAYNAGKSYRKAGDETTAKRFLEMAANYAESENGSVRHYAKQAKKLLETE